MPRGHGPRWHRSLKNNTALCKRLGLGVITVRQRDAFVEVHLDPPSRSDHLGSADVAREVVVDGKLHVEGPADRVDQRSSLAADEVDEQLAPRSIHAAPFPSLLPFDSDSLRSTR